jgi:phthalate 4,5-cis-dihydrodiol dehydrogenase
VFNGFVSAPSSSTADAPIRIGVLGLGAAGRAAVAAVERSPFTALAAVCDLDPGVLEATERRHGCAGYFELAAMCGDRAVEAVYVATPTFLREAHIRELAAAGKHLLVEKPVASGGALARQLLECCQHAGILAAAVNTRGRDPSVQLLARVVEAGELGAVRAVLNVNYTPWTLRPRFDYELDETLGGGVIFRQAPHQVEIVRSIIHTPVRRVAASASRSVEPVATVGGFQALIDFEGGACASLVYNGYGFFDTSELTEGIGEGGARREPGAGMRLREARAWSLDKYGEQGARARELELGPDGVEHRGAALSTYGFTVVSCERGDLRQTPRGVRVYGEHSITELTCDPDSGGLAGDLEDLWRALRHGLPLAHDLAFGVETVEICEAISRAAGAAAS